MAKRRRQDSSRASWLATNSSKGIGRLRVHSPPGERKSGMPHSVEIPAPVKGTILDAPAIISPSGSTPRPMSEAITANSPSLPSYQIQYGWPDGYFGVRLRRAYAALAADSLVSSFLRMASSAFFGLAMAGATGDFLASLPYCDSLSSSASSSACRAATF